VAFQPETQKTESHISPKFCLQAPLPAYTADTWVDHSYRVPPWHLSSVVYPEGCRRLSQIMVVVF